MAAYLKGKIKASGDCYGEFLTWPGYVEKVEAETNTRANSKTNTNDHKPFYRTRVRSLVMLVSD